MIHKVSGFWFKAQKGAFGRRFGPVKVYLVNRVGHLRRVTPVCFRAHVSLPAAAAVCRRQVDVAAAVYIDMR